MLRIICIIAVLGATLAACGTSDLAPAPSPSGDAGPSSVAPAGGGQEVYENRVAGANTFRCATCHAITEPTTNDGLRRPGHPIGDATRRPNYKNGQVPRLLDAVNSCLTEWMNATPWTETDSRFVALYAWLDQQAGAAAPAPAVTFARVDPPRIVSGGDADRGRATFNGSCIVCHGEDGTGTERAPNVRGLGLDPGYIATRIRTSGRADSKVYPGLTGGVMPFWSADRLSDAELVDLVSFLEKEDPARPETSAGGTFDMTTRTCAKTHPRVAQRAVLQRYIHGTSGVATIIDDCTVDITGFAFDGGGIDVRVYGGLRRDFQRGFAMGNDLRRPGGYKDAKVRVNLPPGRSLDDLDGISIWCVPAGANFADGLLE